MEEKSAGLKCDHRHQVESYSVIQMKQWKLKIPSLWDDVNSLLECFWGLWSEHNKRINLYNSFLDANALFSLFFLLFPVDKSLCWYRTLETWLHLQWFCSQIRYGDRSWSQVVTVLSFRYSIKNRNNPSFRSKDCWCYSHCMAWFGYSQGNHLNFLYFLKFPPFFRALNSEQ